MSLEQWEAHYNKLLRRNLEEFLVIYLKFKYPINDPDKFEIDTNAKKGVVSDLISDFIQSQVGAGKDESKPNEHEVYEIELRIDLTDDTWFTKDNCGNKGLRDGILMDILGRLSKQETQAPNNSDPE